MTSACYIQLWLGVKMVSFLLPLAKPHVGELGEYVGRRTQQCLPGFHLRPWKLFQAVQMRAFCYRSKSRWAHTKKGEGGNLEVLHRRVMSGQEAIRIPLILIWLHQKIKRKDKVHMFLLLICLLDINLSTSFLLNYFLMLRKIKGQMAALLKSSGKGRPMYLNLSCHQKKRHNKNYLSIWSNKTLLWYMQNRY